MTAKSEKTTDFILEQVAPIFNRLGYVGTSMSDITNATGLTKGAIYGNFKNKEDLSIQAFNRVIKLSIGYVSHMMMKHAKAKDQLKALTDVYKRYYEITLDLGGCPIINMGSDANNQHPALMARVTSVMKKLVSNIAVIIEQGQKEGDFKIEINPQELAMRIYSTIQGSIFTSTMMKDENHMPRMMEYLENAITKELHI